MSSQQKVFMTRNIVPDAISKLQEYFDVEIWDRSVPPSKEVLIEKLQGFDGVMTEVSDIMDDDILSSCGSLKIVANRAIGYDNIDLDSASRNRIFVSNTPGILHESCADFTMALMLSLARQVTRSNRKVIAGEWKFFDQTPYLGTDVFGKTLGLLGMGEIATAVVKRAAGLIWKYYIILDLENQILKKHTISNGYLLMNCFLDLIIFLFTFHLLRRLKI